MCVVVNAGGGNINGNQARCTCPDGQRLDSNGKTCDGADEPALALPLVCKCRNGGYCSSEGFSINNYLGHYSNEEARSLGARIGFVFKNAEKVRGPQYDRLIFAQFRVNS